MIIQLSWDNFKKCKNGQGQIFYRIENEYSSNDPEVKDISRYFLEMTKNSDQLQCFVLITDPKNEDQIEFEDSYKSSAIEII